MHLAPRPRALAPSPLQPLYRAVRAGAVRMRPCALPLIYIAASSLELEVSAVPEMAWLAEMIISCPPTFQPAGWCVRAHAPPCAL